MDLYFQHSRVIAGIYMECLRIHLIYSAVKLLKTHKKDSGTEIKHKLNEVLLLNIELGKRKINR